MSFIESTTAWTAGEMYQGKLMLVLGALLIIACYLLWFHGSTLSKGVSLPLFLVVLVCFGYGGWLVGGRPAQLESIKVQYTENAVSVIDEQRQMAAQNLTSYEMFKRIWVAIIVCSIAAIFVTSNPFYYGVAIGFLLFGATALTMDTFFSHRLGVYAERISISEEVQ